MLVQFAEMGAAYVPPASGPRTPRWGCSPSGRSRRRARLWSRRPTGSCPAAPGRPDPGVRVRGEPRGAGPARLPADVVVTDGFTGNVALKALEGSLRFVVATRSWASSDRRGDEAGGRRPAAAPPAAGGRARAGEHGRRDAARDGRSLRDQPRVFERNRGDERDPRGPRMCGERARRAGCRRGPPCAQDLKIPGHGPKIGNSEPENPKLAPVPAETHTNQGPLDRNGVFELIRISWGHPRDGPVVDHRGRVRSSRTSTPTRSP